MLPKGFMVWIFLVLAFPAGSLAQEKPLKPAPEVTTEKIQGWIQNLNSPNFDEREIAITNLLEAGKKAAAEYHVRVLHCAESRREVG